MKKIISAIILFTLLVTSVPITHAATGYTKNNIDSYVGKIIIDLNYYHSSKGYYPYSKRLDKNGNMQCVGYAYARLEEKLGLSPDFSSGNGAKDIPDNAPNNATRTAADGTVYTIKVYKNDGGKNIVANSWVSFGPEKNIYGHVIYVEEVIGDTIYFTEGGESMWKKGTVGTLKKKSRSDFINNCSSGGSYIGTVVFSSGKSNNGGNHICSKYETYKNGSTKILGACKECHKKYDYSKIYNDGVAGLWIAKKSQNINLYNEPYEDASYTSVKSGELEVAGYVKNAYGNKWYVINGDKSKTYYVYENTFKNLYTQNSNYYENDYHKYDSGNIIENQSTSNNVNNNTSLGNSVVGTVDIPSSWDNLSIRSGPSTNYQIVGSMNDGVQCTVYPDKTCNGWYYVNYNGIWGYASGKQINISSSSVPSQPQTQTPTYTPTPASPSEPTPNAKKTIKVYFDSTGGSTEYAAQSVEEYGAITIPTKTPSKNGYDFLGWDTNPNAITPAYRSMQTINVGNTDMTLYAIWQRISTSWDEWDLSVSKDEVYFDNDDYKKTVIVKVDEQDNREYYFTLEYDEYIDVEFGEEYYDEHGYFCREIIVYAPEEKLVHDEVIIRLRDGNDDIVDTVGFNVYLKENNGVQFADRNQTGITVYLNGEKLYFDVQPQIINGRTMVPMRKIFEELGTVVGWNNNTQTAIATTKDDIIRISIGGINMSCNGEQKLLDSPAVVISGRTLVPVRAIAESLKCDVDWYDYGVNQVVDINMTRNIDSIENKNGLVIGWSDFAPFSYIDENGSLVGFDTELAKYVCDFWGWDYSFIEIPFDMKFAAIEAGQIDCYWNGVTKTEERMENATFTNDYVEYTMQYEEDGEWYTSQECYAVPFKKGEYDLVELVNIALEEAQKDGTIEHLKWKYEIQ